MSWMMVIRIRYAYQDILRTAVGAHGLAGCFDLEKNARMPASCIHQWIRAVQRQIIRTDFDFLWKWIGTGRKCIHGRFSLV